MKKLLLFILLVMMQPMTILADERVAIDGIKYDLVSNSKQAVVISFDNGKYKGDVVIPSSVNYYGVTYNVTRIGDGAFQNCTELTSVKLPSNITDLGLYSFSGCTRLISVNIPSKVSYIGNYAFDGCISLKSISFSNVNIITDGMFRGCTSLTSITIPNIVKEIRDEAFFGCSNITSITIPQNVTSIGEKVFGGCVNLASINVSSENATYDSRNSCNAIIEKSSKTLITGCKSTKIPSSVTSIGNDAFYNCSSLTGITIPNSITTIGHNAFNGCSSLKIVEIPNSVKKIYNSAFRGCSRLKMVDIGDGVEGIGDYAFGHCNELAYFTCRATSVPETSSSAFSRSQTENATLIVPSNSLNSYNAKTPWSSFGKKLTLSTANVVVMALCLHREYGEANPTFAYIANSLLEGTPTLTCSATKTSSPGIYTIKVSKGSVTNTKILFVNGELTVTKAPLTIKPNDYTINVGDPMPTFDATYTGLKNNETEDVLSPVFSCTAADTNTPGVYDITVSATSDNYDMTFEKGTLTILPTIATITISNVGVATYCFDFGLDFSNVTDFKAYIATGYNRHTGNVIVQPIKEAPAGTGLYLKGKPGTYQLPIYESDSYFVNMLKGVTMPTTIQAKEGEYTNFVLYATNSSDACFRPLSDTYNLKANRAYLQIPTIEVAVNGNVNSVGIEFEEGVTEIEEHFSSPSSSQTIWYSLDGRKFNTKPTQKGVYVINGRKVVIK